MSDPMLTQIQRHNAGYACAACGYYHHPENECGPIDRKRMIRRGTYGPAQLPEPPTFDHDEEEDTDA